MVRGPDYGSATNLLKLVVVAFKLLLPSLSSLITLISICSSLAFISTPRWSPKLPSKAKKCMSVGSQERAYVTNSRTAHYHLPILRILLFTPGGDSAYERDGDARRKF